MKKYPNYLNNQRLRREMEKKGHKDIVIRNGEVVSSTAPPEPEKPIGTLQDLADAGLLGPA